MKPGFWHSLAIVSTPIYVVLGPQSATAQKDVGDKLAAQAVSFCSNPAQYGYSVETKGRVSGTITAGRIARLITGASGSADIGGAASKYQGVAQDQLAKALSDSNSCRLKALDTFRQIYFDSKKDVASGKLANGPSSQSSTSKRPSIPSTDASGGRRLTRANRAHEARTLSPLNSWLCASLKVPFDPVKAMTAFPLDHLSTPVETRETKDTGSSKATWVSMRAKGELFDVEYRYAISSDDGKKYGYILQVSQHRYDREFGDKVGKLLAEFGHPKDSMMGVKIEAGPQLFRGGDSVFYFQAVDMPAWYSANWWEEGDEKYAQSLCVPRAP